LHCWREKGEKAGTKGEMDERAAELSYIPGTVEW
jgi:hypothetical protein